MAAAARRLLFGPRGWIVFVPAAQSPFKQTGTRASAADRVALLRAATGRISNTVIWTDEIDRAGRNGAPSYTVDTIRRLRRLRPGSDIRLLIGSDQVAEFSRWKDAARLLVLAPPAVVYRPPVDTPARLRRAAKRSKFPLPGPADFWMQRVVRAPIDPMSSTQTRRLLERMHRTGRVPEALRRMLDPGVLRFIRAHRLYAD